MGDPTGESDYGSDISSKSIDRWQESFTTNFRIKSGHTYLNWLGSDNLSKMGYSIDELASSLNQIKARKSSIPDILHHYRNRHKTRTQIKAVRFMRDQEHLLRLR